MLKVKQERTPETSLTHHELVKLLALDALSMHGRKWFSLLHQDPFEEALATKIEQELAEAIDPFVVVEVVDPEENALEEDLIV